MRLNSFRLQNFRNHADSTIDLTGASFVVLRGSNFAGKSSVAQGISMALTPSTDALDEQGRGFVSKIRWGQTKAVLTAIIQGKHIIERTVTLNQNTSGRTPKNRCLDDDDWHPLPFENFLDYNRPALSVALNTTYFLSLAEKDQMNLLAKMALPPRYDFPAEKIQAVERAIGPGLIDFTGEPFAVIKATYKLLYETRTQANADVKACTIPEALPLPSGIDSNSLQGKINAARQRREQIGAERDAAVRKANEVEVKRTRLQSRIERDQEKAKEESNRLGEIQKQVLSEAKVKSHEFTLAGKDEYAQLTAERNQLAVTIREKNEELARLEGLPDAGTNCPTCLQVVDGEKLRQMAFRSAHERDTAVRRDNEILRRMQELGDVAGAESALAKHTAALEAKKATESILMEKNRLVRDGNVELQAMPAAVDATLAFAQPLADVDAEINNLIAEMRPVIAAEERVKEIAKKTEELNKLKAKAASVSGLVKYFDKDGIKAELLAKHIGSFEKSINETLAAWGYSCALSMEPYQFEVRKPDGVTLAIKELSGSEALMFSVALQCAVSRAAGIGLVVADRMDTFLPAERAKANRALYTATQSGALEQVVLIVSDTSKEVPNLPGARFFYVENGAVTVLQPKAA